MALQEKYAELIQAANTMGVENFAIAEQGNALHISGTAKTTADYDALWAIYGKLDPNMAQAI